MIDEALAEELYVAWAISIGRMPESLARKKWKRVIYKSGWVGYARRVREIMEAERAET